MKLPIQLYFILLGLISFHGVSGQDRHPVLEPAAITSGELPNGMHYYIMENEEPKDRAAFYFAQNVGSILEGDNQLGLAHFLEHMAFNGTEHFPDKQLLNYLQENGIKFGTEINAFTDYDETVYSIRNVPVHNERLLDSILLMLHDWSGRLTLAEEEIDMERGVVQEEWRSRYHPRKRVEDTIKNKGLLTGSRYAARTPIGTMGVINNFEYDELKSFYKQWYRPDLQAVIVVGAVDATRMEEKVKALFSDIPKRAYLPQRPSYTVPISDELIYLNVTDKELGNPTIEYYIKHPLTREQSEKEELKHKVKAGILNSLIDKRLSKTSNLPSGPALSARFSLETVVRPLEVLKLSIQPKRDSILTALEFGLTELKRFSLHGANPEEFEAIKSSRIRSLESSLNRNGNSNVFNAIKIYEAFLENRQLIDYHSQLRYQLQYLKELKPEDIHEFFTDYYSSKGTVVAITGTDALDYPTQEEVLQSVKKAEVSSPSAYKEIVTQNKLMELDLPGSEIIKEERVRDDKATKFTLSNGARVWLFDPLTEEEGIHFRAMSPGGRSLLPQELLSNSLFATVFTAESGIANLNKRELRASDEITPVKVAIEENQEIMEGYTNANNLGNLLKGVYLAFTAPRFDEEIFEVNKQGLENIHAILKGNVQGVLVDSMQMAKSNYSDRLVLFNQKMLDELSMDAIEELYRDRIRHPADFDFVFLGSVDREKFIQDIETYIGSIPGSGTVETAVDHNMTPTPGVHKVHLSREMSTPQASVQIHLTGSMAYNSTNQLVLRLVEELLAKRYMQRIREEEGGTYGVKVTGTLRHTPQEAFALDISFNCHPEKAEQLVAIVYEELQNLTTQINQKEFVEILTNLEKEIRERTDNNTQYFSKIIDNILSGTAITTTEEELQRLQAITEMEIKQGAVQINTNPTIIEGILLPLESDSN